MFTRKPRLQLEQFAINGAKRLLQHNLPNPAIASKPTGTRSLNQYGFWPLTVTRWP